MLSSRVAYREELVMIAEKNSKILCLEADLGGAKHPFQKAHPDRFINLGISELAAVDVAGGLAAAGFIPFLSTFAPFAVLRAAESMKLTMGYMSLNVKIVAPYAGVSGAWFGTTHHSLEDLSIVQSFPGITIAAPYGEKETREVIRYAAETDGPFYIRMGRNDAFESLEPRFPSSSGKVLWHQKELMSQHDKDICLISVGERGTDLAIQAVSAMPRLAHAHLCFVDYYSLNIIASELNANYHRFIVIEEHRPTGGIASTLALLLPQAQIYDFNCGTQWPTCGGEHTEVLSELGFSLEKLLIKIEEIQSTEKVSSQ